MKRVCAAFLLVAMVIPATAQQQKETFNVRSRADCIANFRSADVNANGVLSQSELRRSPSIVPTTLVQRSSIDRQTYLSACRQLVMQMRK